MSYHEQGQFCSKKGSLNRIKFKKTEEFEIADTRNNVSALLYRGEEKAAGSLRKKGDEE